MTRAFISILSLAAAASLPCSVAAQAPAYSAFCDTPDREPVVVDGYFRCPLRMVVDDLTGTGMVGNTFRSIALESDLVVDVFDALARIRNDRVDLPEAVVSFEAQGQRGQTITGTFTLNPTVYISGAEVCSMRVERAAPGFGSLTLLSGADWPPFVRASLVRGANGSDKLARILADLFTGYLPQIQASLGCPA